ncbi:MAG: GspE/PulE family protein [Chromatiales bacterium]|nr:GspE/PulE family protein [Chromatiales bacterium]
MLVNKAIPLPAPPLCTGGPEHQIRAGESVLLSLLDGRQIDGGLMDFDAAGARLQVLPAGQHGGVLDLPLSEIKLLRLPQTRPWSRRQDPNLAGMVLPPDMQHFQLRLRDGTRVSGTSFGTSRDANGLFLFPTNDGARYSLAFVPNAMVDDCVIGPKIGEVLMQDQAISEEAMKTAIARQQELRTRPVGEYLANTVVNPEDLERALKRQKSMPHMKLGEVLISEGVITAQQLEQALTEQKKDRKKPLGEILVGMGLVTRANIQQSLARKLGIPFVNLRKFPVEPGVLKLVPMELAKKYRLIPLYLYEDKLVIAVENPMLWEPLEAVRFHTQKHAEPVLAVPEEIDWAIDYYYIGAEVGSLTGMDFDDALVLPVQEEEQSISIEERSITENVVVKLVNKIIADAHRQNASDIHIEPSPGRGKTLIRIRRDGTLFNYNEVPNQYRDALVSRIKVMANLDISERRKPQDGKIDFGRYSPLKIELRVAILPTAGGTEDVVMRILRTGKPIPLEKLDLGADNRQKLIEAITKPYGIFIVCGPTGSGKTTTLHSILGYLNDSETKIWTAEDPIEITQPGLRQVQVNPRIGLTFASAMRSFLRADPDVIMVGEMRDPETAKVGLEASLTGHIVFSTLHTNSAAESIVRLLDMGMDPFNFADAMLGVLAQRLAKRLCPDCRSAYQPSVKELFDLAMEYYLDAAGGKAHAPDSQVLDDTIKRWREAYAPSGKFTFYKAVGCEACGHTGYRGRIGIHELLIATDMVKRKIVERVPMPELLAEALAEGMRTLKQDGIEKVLQGITDIAQIRAVCIK